MSKQPKLKLYNYFRSSASWRVRVALYYKGLDFEYIPIGLLPRDHESAEYAKLNPMCQVPCLVVEEEGEEPFVLSQSRAIIAYLDKRFPEKTFILNDIKKQAKAEEYADDICAGIQPIQNLAVLKRVEALTGKKEESTEWAAWAIDKGFTALETKASKSAGKYLIGDDFSIADVVLIPQIYNARRFKVDVSKFPTLLRVEQNIVELPFMKLADPANQPDAF